MTRTVSRRPVPHVYKRVIKSIPTDLMDWANRRFADHEENWGFDESVTISGLLSGCRGPVGLHVDDEARSGSLIWGLVLRSDQHVLVDGPMMHAVADLEPGDVYVLDPYVYHGTLCLSADDALMFGVIEVPKNDDRRPLTIGKDILAKLGEEMMADVLRDMAERQRERDRHAALDPLTAALIAA